MGSNYRRKIPKHVQIYQWLRAMIAKGEIKRGDKLPTEIELSHMFAVNRMTVRKAMDSLVFDAMVIRRPGKGTFLTSEKPKDLIYTLKNITSFGNDMQSVGIQPTYQAVEVKVIQADGEVSKMLKLKNDKRAIYSLRVLHANDKPVLIEKSYLPYFKFKDILDMDGGVPRRRRDQNIRPARALSLHEDGNCGVRSPQLSGGGPFRLLSWR
jgi:DNA-binding GntR family transcriptional regulator